METKYKVIVVVVSIATAFAVGRYTVPQKVLTVTRVVEVEKKLIETDKDTTKDTKIVEIVRPDGTKETTTIINENKKVDQTVVDNKDSSSDAETETEKTGSPVTINALAGLDLKSGATVFGASVSKPVIGPIAIGLWGLTNATVGASIGLVL